MAQRRIAMATVKCAYIPLEGSIRRSSAFLDDGDTLERVIDKAKVMFNHTAFQDLRVFVNDEQISPDRGDMLITEQHELVLVEDEET